MQKFIQHNGIYLLISLFLTAIIPDGLFFYKNNPGVEFFITFLFVLKSVIAIFIYYGFSGKILMNIYGIENFIISPQNNATNERKLLKKHILF